MPGKKVIFLIKNYWPVSSLAVSGKLLEEQMFNSILLILEIFFQLIKQGSIMVTLVFINLRLTNSSLEVRDVLLIISKVFDRV